MPFKSKAQQSFFFGKLKPSLAKESRKKFSVLPDRVGKKSRLDKKQESSRTKSRRLGT